MLNNYQTEYTIISTFSAVGISKKDILWKLVETRYRDIYTALENEYQDWITRYECNTKAQESIFERLSFKKWDIKKSSYSFYWCIAFTCNECTKRKYS